MQCQSTSSVSLKYFLLLFFFLNNVFLFFFHFLRLRGFFALLWVKWLKILKSTFSSFFQLIFLLISLPFPVFSFRLPFFFPSVLLSFFHKPHCEYWPIIWDSSEKKNDVNSKLQVWICVWFLLLIIKIDNRTSLPASEHKKIEKKNSTRKPAGRWASESTFLYFRHWPHFPQEYRHHESATNIAVPLIESIILAVK